MKKTDVNTIGIKKFGANLPLTIEEKWELIQNRFLAAHPNLNREKYNYKKGKFDAMLRRMGLKIGKSRLELIKEIKDFE